MNNVEDDEEDAEETEDDDGETKKRKVCLFLYHFVACRCISILFSVLLPNQRLPSPPPKRPKLLAPE